MTQTYVLLYLLNNWKYTGTSFSTLYLFTSGGLNSSIPPSIFCLSALFTCLAFWTLVKNNKVNQLHKESWSLYTHIFTRIATSVPPKLERETLWFKAPLLLTASSQTHAILERKTKNYLNSLSKDSDLMFV